jgi:hypothetical protein
MMGEMMRKLEGPFDPKPMSEMMRKLLGEFPDGKLNPNDEGATAIQVGRDQGKVIIQFPNPTKWIGFTPDEAAELARVIFHHAKKCGLTKPVTFEL